MRRLIITLHNDCTQETLDLLESKGCYILYGSEVLPKMVAVETNGSVADLVRLNEVAGVRLEAVGNLCGEPLPSQEVSELTKMNEKLQDIKRDYERGKLLPSDLDWLIETIKQQQKDVESFEIKIDELYIKIGKQQATIKPHEQALKEIRDYEAYSWRNDRDFINSRIDKIMGVFDNG